MAFELSSENLKKYKDLLTKYDDVESALLPVLHMCQEQNGYLSEEVQKTVSELMNIPVIKIKEVISFYDMFYDEPTAKHVVHVCTNITCSMFGSRDVFQGLLKHFQTENMKPTSNGKYFFQKMECLGACEIAPCMRIGNDFVPKITLDSAIKQLEGLK